MFAFDETDTLVLMDAVPCVIYSPPPIPPPSPPPPSPPPPSPPPAPPPAPFEQTGWDCNNVYDSGPTELVLDGTQSGHTDFPSPVLGSANMNDGSILWPKGNEPFSVEVEMSMEPHATSSYDFGWMVMWQDDARTDFAMSWHSYNNCPRFGFRHKNAALNKDFMGGGNIADPTHSYKFFNNGHTTTSSCGGYQNPRWYGSFSEEMAPPSTSFAWSMTAPSGEPMDSRMATME